MFRRGFTGHEHLIPFTGDNGGRLINMNARLYDPILGRFLAPDPYVGSGLTNDFNRYIYCRNNPLMFTDPSGKFVQWIVAGIIIAAKSYYDGYNANHNEANPLNWDWKKATFSVGFGGSLS
jgi:RHS repeat-associated protein